MVHRPKMINERILLKVHKRTQFYLTAHVSQTSSGFISSSSYPDALGIQLDRNRLNLILTMGGKTNTIVQRWGCMYPNASEWDSLVACCIVWRGLCVESMYRWRY